MATLQRPTDVWKATEMLLWSKWQIWQVVKPWNRLLKLPERRRETETTADQGEHPLRVMADMAMKSNPTLSWMLHAIYNDLPQLDPAVQEV
jgi:hypothetical protein